MSSPFAKQMNIFLKFVVESKMDELSFDTNTNVLKAKNRDILLNKWNYVILNQNGPLRTPSARYTLSRNFNYHNIIFCNNYNITKNLIYQFPVSYVYNTDTLSKRIKKKKSIPYDPNLGFNAIINMAINRGEM